MDRTTFRAAVFVIVRDVEGRVLLQRRAHTGFMDGYYDFPSGHVETDESFTTSAMRELAEEVGLTVTEADLRIVHINQNYLDFPYITVMFDALAWNGTPTIMEPHKCDDLQFFSVDDLPAQCTLAVRCVEAAGFGRAQVTSSYIDKTAFEKLFGSTPEELIT